MNFTKYVNQVYVTGHMTGKPVVRKLRTGDSVMRFSLKTQEEFLGEDGQSRFVKQNVQITTMGNNAFGLINDCDSSSLIAVEGRLVSRHFRDKKGQLRNVTEIRANGVDVMPA